MAKKVIAQIKLQIPAGSATPAPPVGTALGPAGVFWAVAVSYSINAVVGLALFRRGRWKTRTV